VPTLEIKPAKQRATAADEKLARREHILEAAERLYARSLDLPSVADVATEAGLAKGTMYLYFDTKESLYLALHERHTRDFFAALNTRLAEPKPFDFDAIAALLDQHMIGNASFLPLGNACLCAPMGHVPSHVHDAFEAKLRQWMSQAGSGLERQFPALQPGDGMRLLRHSYALMLGMRQLMGADLPITEASRRCALPGVGSFRAEAMTAVHNYWNQAVTQGLSLPPAAASRPPRKKKP
jgi:AcrR family transcriptional regulator